MSLWLPPRVPAEAQQELAWQALRWVCGSSRPSSRVSPADPGFSVLVWSFSLTAEALLRTSRAWFFESTTPTPAHLVRHALAAGPATPLGAGYPRTSGRVAWGQKGRWWTGPAALPTISHRAQGITINPSPQGGPAPRVLAWLWAPSHLLLCSQGLSLLFCVLMARQVWAANVPYKVFCGSLCYFDLSCSSQNPFINTLINCYCNTGENTWWI